MNPNILYFVCHDLGRALGSYGAGISTPHLDKFAAQGLKFTNAHCASPACSPSRACAMSGLHAHTSGALGLSHMGWPLDRKWSTTVDDFNAAGYQTILSGINHERHPRSDRYEVDLARDWDDWKLPRVVDNALAALKARDGDRPFYLNVATQEPHACVWKDVGGRIPGLPEGRPVWVPQGMPQTPALTEAFRRFAAAVSYLDAEFGRLMQGISDLGLAEKTLIVFTTDHGMSGPRGKGSLYGLGTEIALLMRLPDGTCAGESRSAPISNLAFRATLGEAAGIPLVSECHGRSFWPYVLRGTAPPDEDLFLERNFHGEMPWRTEGDYLDVCDPMRAIRTNSHLYIRNFSPAARPREPLPGVISRGPQDWENWESSWELPAALRPAEELYALHQDPLELDNVANHPENAGTVRTLREKLVRWMRDTHDYPPGPPPLRPEAPGWGSQWI